MVGYVTFGTNDMERAGRFYDELLEPLGGKRIMNMDSFVLWGRSLEEACLALAKPFDGNQATVGNGVMVALQAESKEQADAIYAKAIELGATDEGKPGPRGDGFYAGYFRDLEGNKLNAFFLG
jgi:catechol 2,3-dioxygenase-like lactoylglutathione lyase family enzyme